jgi:hypothetical protein
MKSLKESMLNESLDRDDFVKLYTVFALVLATNAEKIVDNMGFDTILDKYGVDAYSGEGLKAALVENPEFAVEMVRSLIEAMDGKNLLDKEDKRKMLLLLLPKIRQAARS